MNRNFFLCLQIVILLSQINLPFANAHQTQIEGVKSVLNQGALSTAKILSKKGNNMEIPTGNSIEELLNVLIEGDLLLLDIDDTILLPGKIKYLDTAVLIERNLPDIIKKLQDKGVILLFLTARCPMFSEITERQLKDLGINVFDSTKIKEIKNLNKGGLFSKGIIYAPNQGKKSMKGEVFKSFLEKCSHQEDASECQLKNIKRIFLVDDLKNNIEGLFFAFCDDHRYKDISFKGYVFVSPKGINQENKQIKHFPNVFEMFCNLFYLSLSILKYYFSCLCTLLGF